MVTYDHVVNLAASQDFAAFDAAIAAINDESVRECLLGYRDEQLSEFESAREHFETALTRSTVDPWVAQAAPARLVFMLLVTGDIEAAIVRGEQELLKFQSLKPYPIEQEIALKSILANVYSSRGEMTRAISLTAERPKHVGAPAMDANWGWARAVVLFHHGMVHEALETNVEATRAARETGSPNFIASMNDNTYWMKSVLGQPLSDDEMAELTSRNESQATGGSSPFDIENHLVLAFAHAVRGDVNAARKILADLNDNHTLRGAELVRAATILDVIGDTEASVETYLRSVDLLEDETQPMLAAAVWNKLAQVFESRGEQESALHCLKLAVRAVGVATDGNANPLCITT